MRDRILESFWSRSFWRPPVRYRRVEDNVQLVEFNCVPFVKELMYDPVTGEFILTPPLVFRTARDNAAASDRI
jgi:hypothetical protein